MRESRHALYFSDRIVILAGWRGSAVISVSGIRHERFDCVAAAADFGVRGVPADAGHPSRIPPKAKNKISSCISGASISRFMICVTHARVTFPGRASSAS